MIKRKLRRKINFLLTILVMCFLFNVCLPHAAQIPAEMKKYTFEFYSNHFKDVLFPKIEDHLKQYNVFHEEDSKQLAEEIALIIIEDCTKEKILLFRPPDVKVLKIANEEVVTYTLEMHLAVFDGEESTNIFLTSMTFGKRFLIFFKNLKQVEI